MPKWSRLAEEKYFGPAFGDKKQNGSQMYAKNRF
jgi:hypothetical protein